MLKILVVQICVPHPKYPTTRVAIRVQSVGFQFSPARYHRIMQVVEVFSGGPDVDATQSAFRPWDSPDFDGKMMVLSWKVSLCSSILYCCLFSLLIFTVYLHVFTATLLCHDSCTC